jgi:RimJ/RimL family protein N-acetyltransferase
MVAICRPLAVADDLESHRLVLRDGSIATVRPTVPSDHQAMVRFFHNLSPEARRHRFFLASETPDSLIDQFCATADLTDSLTLIACRRPDPDEPLIAVASYFRLTDTVAEVAFAVDDHLHGRGIATLLLGRLAGSASANGFTRFQAMTMTDNIGMLDVFRDSGFEIRSTTVDDTVYLQLSLLRTVQ